MIWTEPLRGRGDWPEVHHHRFDRMVSTARLIPRTDGSAPEAVQPIGHRDGAHVIWEADRLADAGCTADMSKPGVDKAPESGRGLSRPGRRVRQGRRVRYTPGEWLRLRLGPRGGHRPPDEGHLPALHGQHPPGLHRQPPGPLIAAVDAPHMTVSRWRHHGAEHDTP